MKEEKNHVGRPTNEEVRQRRNAKIVKILLPTIVVALVILMAAKYVKGGELQGAAPAATTQPKVSTNCNFSANYGTIKVDNAEVSSGETLDIVPRLYYTCSGKKTNIYVNRFACNNPNTNFKITSTLSKHQKKEKNNYVKNVRFDITDVNNKKCYIKYDYSKLSSKYRKQIYNYNFNITKTKLSKIKATGSYVNKGRTTSFKEDIYRFDLVKCDLNESGKITSTFKNSVEIGDTNYGLNRVSRWCFNNGSDLAASAWGCPTKFYVQYNVSKATTKKGGYVGETNLVITKTNGAKCVIYNDYSSKKVGVVQYNFNLDKAYIKEIKATGSYRSKEGAIKSFGKDTFKISK